MSERDLFVAALQITDRAERSAWLDRECGGDATLRRRVEALLAALDGAGSPRDSPAFARGATAGPTGQDAAAAAAGQEPSPGAPGTLIGPYKLLQQIGEGGMGT